MAPSVARTVYVNEDGRGKEEERVKRVRAWED